MPAPAVAHAGLAFSLSRLLADKMVLTGQVQSVSGGGGAGGGRGPPAVGRKAWTDPRRGPAWLVQRCPGSTMARLDVDGGCFCGKRDRTALACPGGNDDSDDDEENDGRTAICVQDLREDRDRDETRMQEFGSAGDPVDRRAGSPGQGWAGQPSRQSRSKRRRATCGLEYREGFDPESQKCPVGYVRVAEDEGGPFLCQHTASPYSCGRHQRDCYARPGILQAGCTDDGVCEILMCKEGWRFQLADTDDSDEPAASSCVPGRPLFYNTG